MRRSSVLENLRADLCLEAQKIYDDWEQDEDGYDEEYGHGGICQDIASAFCDVLSELDIECTIFSPSIGEIHVFSIANIDGEAYQVDIPPYVYERGGGYCWQKIPEVIFEPSDIIIEPMGFPFQDYLEEAF